MDTSTEIYDLLDLVSFTLSDKFLDKWQYKYSRKFIVMFQLKLLDSFQGKKPLNKGALTKFLATKGKYNIAQINNFYDSIDITLYSPLINCSK